MICRSTRSGALALRQMSWPKISFTLFGRRRPFLEGLDTRITIGTTRFRVVPIWLTLKLSVKLAYASEN